MVDGAFVRKGTATDTKVDPMKRALARRFRALPTAAEATAWEIVRGRRLLGLKFRRQVVIEGFIVDLLCVELGLVIELDGDSHQTPEARAYDECRSAVITARGWRELRLPNEHATLHHLTDLLRPLLPAPPLRPSPERSAGSEGEGVGG